VNLIDPDGRQVDWSFGINLGLNIGEFFNSVFGKESLYENFNVEDKMEGMRNSNENNYQEINVEQELNIQIQDSYQYLSVAYGRQSTILPYDRYGFGALSLTSDGVFFTGGFDAGISYPAANQTISLSLGYTKNPNQFGPSYSMNFGLYGIGGEVYTDFQPTPFSPINITGFGIMFSNSEAWIDFSIGGTIDLMSFKK